MRKTFLRVVLPITFLVAQLSLGSTVSVSPWTPIFQGIDQSSGTIYGTNASVANAVRIDTTAAGISFLTTPKSGPQQTISETTSQFVTRYGTAVAVNANFFAPCCSTTPEPKSLTGLAVSNGTLVAPPSGTAGNSNVAFLVSSTNSAAIRTTTANLDLTNVYNAVAGSALIVSNGTNIGASSPSEGDPANPNPRTDVGISQDGRYVYLVTIDGRQPGYSAGTNMVETADIMLGFGSYTAMNLGGGGSTSLVRSDGAGGAVSLNRPSGGTERYDANHLGVYALPLATPEPATYLLFGLGLPAMLVLRRRRTRS